MDLEIPFDTPSKKNSRITDTRTGRSFPSRAYSEWHRKACLWLRSAYGPLKCIASPLAVKMEFTHGTLRRSDSDNKVSSVLDLLVDLGVIEDDSWKIVRRIEVENAYVKGKPSCRVKIRHIEDFENADSGKTG